MIEPKITMMSYRDGKVLGRVVVNGHEIAVQPFKVELGISAIEIENKLI